MRTFQFVLALLFFVTSAFADTTYVSGSQSGEWTTDGNPYILTSSVFVPEHQVLVLRPGVRVEFQNNHEFLIRGWIECLGELGDSIFFTQDTLAFPVRWRGFRFTNFSAETSIMRYVVIEYAGSRAGIQQLGTSFTLEHSTIRYCAPSGIDIVSQSLILEDCALVFNGYGSCGGAVHSHDATVTMRRVWIEGNTSLDGGALCFYNSELIVSESTIIRNEGHIWGGAIYSDSTALTFTNCVFDSNISLLGGVGLIHDNAPTKFDHCVFTENSSFRNGSFGNYGVFDLMAQGVNSFTNCLFYRNRGLTNSVMYVLGNSTIEQCVFAENLSGPILGGGIDTARFNSFHVRPIGLGGMPTNFGTMVDTNINGDSIDVYGNLISAPGFDTSGFCPPFNLHYTSHLIDAGDPNGELDEDGSIADLGPYPFHCIGPIQDLTIERVNETNHLRLSWTAVPDADMYRVFRSYGGLFDWETAEFIGEDTATVFVHLDALSNPVNQGTYVVIVSHTSD